MDAEINSFPVPVFFYKYIHRIQSGDLHVMKYKHWRHISKEKQAKMVLRKICIVCERNEDLCVIKYKHWLNISKKKQA